MKTPIPRKEQSQKSSIKLSDLYWYYTKDGSIMTPFVFSKQYDKIKSLLDDTIISISDHDRSNEVIKFHQVAKSITKNSEVLKDSQLVVKPTHQMLVDYYLKYGDSSAQTFFNPMLRKFRKAIHPGDHFNSSEFCKDHPPIDQKTIKQLTNLFKTTVQRAFEETSKHSNPNPKEEYSQEFDF